MKKPEKDHFITVRDSQTGEWRTRPIVDVPFDGSDVVDHVAEPLSLTDTELNKMDEELTSVLRHVKRQGG